MGPYLFIRTIEEKMEKILREKSDRWLKTLFIRHVNALMAKKLTITNSSVGLVSCRLQCLSKLQTDYLRPAAREYARENKLKLKIHLHTSLRHPISLVSSRVSISRNVRLWKMELRRNGEKCDCRRHEARSERKIGVTYFALTFLQGIRCISGTVCFFSSEQSNQRQSNIFRRQLAGTWTSAIFFKSTMIGEMRHLHLYVKSTSDENLTKILLRLHKFSPSKNIRLAKIIIVSFLWLLLVTIKAATLPSACKVVDRIKQWVYASGCTKTDGF